ncbi:MAG TPA: SDR family oxidoreductase [Polyangiaceae bacterium]|nr:SDR family oxidoreductase [Polyangiaceae bacterium]
MSEQVQTRDRRDVNASRVRSFAGWRALVTGASSGIGLELARALVKEGAAVCIAARDEPRLAAAVSDLSALAPPGTPPPCFVSMDVTSPEAIVSGVNQVVAKLGGLDLLINNAGYALPGYIDELDDRAYVEMMAVNYFGPMRLSRQCLEHFIAQGEGRIVNVTSMLGFMGTFGYSAYCASKYALSGYTEALRQDALPFGVKVHLCYPPTTDTPGLARENENKPPEAWAIEGKSRAFSATRVAREILRGVRAGKFHIVVGWDSWFIWLAQRLAPWLVRFVVDRVLRKELRARQRGRALSLPPTPT